MVRRIVRRIICIVLGHYYDYTRGPEKAYCLYCKKIHPGRTRRA